MSMIFPGMDPYLEDPLLWPGLQTGLLVTLSNMLQPFLRPRYVASIEARIWYEQTASRTLEMRDRYLTILDLQAEQRVVTVLEIVSPSAKQVGQGRELYLENTRKALSSPTHLVEIDLLRTGRHVLSVPEKLACEKAAYSYLISINRANRIRDRVEVYCYTLRDRLPIIAVPLNGDSPGVMLDLQIGLEREYEAGCYRERLRYDRPCVPRLSPEDQAWADERIRAAGVVPG